MSSKALDFEGLSREFAESTIRPHVESFAPPDALVIHHFSDDETIVSADWWTPELQITLEVHVSSQVVRWYIQSTADLDDEVIPIQSSLARYLIDKISRRRNNTV